MPFSWIPLLATVFICTVECKFREYPARIETKPETQTVANHGIAVFICIADGHPKPQIEWRKNGKRINSPRYDALDMPRGSLLRIEPVKAGRDEATYKCVADNGVGKPVRASAFLDVHPANSLPEGFPKIIRQPYHQGIEQGSNALIPCQVEGDPKPTVKWFKDKIPLYMSIPRYSLVDGSSLEITAAEREDQGAYECMAENWHGSVMSSMASVYVKARRAPPSFSIRPENLYEVMLGRGLNITCAAVGSPMPIVKWIKGVQDMTPDNAFPIGRNVLVLSDIKESANYTCIAVSTLGSIEATTQVVVRGGVRRSRRMAVETEENGTPAPTNIQAAATSYESIEVWWDTLPPRFFDILGYEVLWVQPHFADLDNWNRKSVPKTYSAEISGLQAHEIYAIFVAARTRQGLGQLSERILVKVNPTDVPTELKAKDVTTHSMYLSWRKPLELEPIRYKISYGAYKEFYDNTGNLQKMHFPTVTVIIRPHITEYYVNDLMPFTSYHVNVTAIPEDEIFRPPAKIIVTTKMAAPTPMVKPDFLGVRSGSEIIVFLPKASEEYGPIGQYLLVVIPNKEARMDSEDFTIDQLSATPTDELGPYIAASFQRHGIPEIFSLGDGEMYNGHLNRRLQHDQKYSIFVRAIVDSPQQDLFTDSPVTDLEF